MKSNLIDSKFII